MIETRSVSFSYNGHNVLDSVSLRVEEGEFIGILGPNGAGKSTLLKIMSKILKPDSGDVSIRGQSIQQSNIKELARELAVLPAEIFFSNDFTVLEVVKMGRSPHLKFWSEGDQSDLEIARESLKMVGISHLEHRNIHSLSSGERQMVFLAQAWAQQPRVLLLDEPTVHLDIHHQIGIFKLLREWNQKANLTILIISHDLNLASQFCQRLVLLNHGQVVIDGRPKEVITEDNIRKVYGIESRVIVDPFTGSPTILFS